MITIQRIASFLYFSSYELVGAPLVDGTILLYIQCVSLQQLQYTGQLRYWLDGHRKNFEMKKQRLYDLFAVQLYNSFESLSLVVVCVCSREGLLNPTGPWKWGKEKPKRRKDCKLLSSFVLPFDQHSQLKAELGKHLLSGAIFLMLISLIARAM